jgi:DNA-binding XRE family transcriptional regulator
MNKVTQFTTPSGDEMVVLARAEYDALVEMAEMLEDVAAYDEAKRRIAEGGDLRVPSEFVDRLIDGENPIRVWRDFRGMTSKDLAREIGISAGYLSEIETGKKEGSISVFRSIAKALRVDVDDLFWGADSKRPVSE